MVVGPSLGGLVTAAWGEHAAAWLAAGGAALSLCIVVYWVPEVPREKRDQGESVLNLKKIGALVLIPRWNTDQHHPLLNLIKTSD